MRRFQNHFGPIHVRSHYVLCVAIVTSWSWMGLWHHCWRRQWLGRVHCTDWEWHLCLECPLRFTPYSDWFSLLFCISCYKRDWEWLPVHCGDQRHAGLCLGRRPCTSRRRYEKIVPNYAKKSVFHGDDVIDDITGWPQSWPSIAGPRLDARTYSRWRTANVECKHGAVSPILTLVFD